MPSTKYFAKIEADQRAAKDARQSADALLAEDFPPFDLNDLVPKNRFKRTAAAQLGRAADWAMPGLLWFFRHWGSVSWPFGFRWITRHRDVLEALERPQDLGVPFKPEMEELSRGADGKECPFVLGLDDEPHGRQRIIVGLAVADPGVIEASAQEVPGWSKDLSQADVERVQAWTREFGGSLIEGAGGRLDVVTDFIVRIPTEICRRHFGLDIADPNAFADWSIAVSGILFADPWGDPVKRRLGLAGAARICEVIDVAIERAKRRSPGEDPKELSLVERLVLIKRERQDLEIADSEIRAILLGLVAGFIPTTGLAATKMFERIMYGRKTRAAATDAAKTASEAQTEAEHEAARRAMEKLVLEAGRLKPALSPGQWRYARSKLHGKFRRIREGATVLVSTQSAMRDRTYRDGSGPANPADLQFGHGDHTCLGRHLATAVIVEMFLLLFSQERFRLASDRRGVTEWLGFFPRHLDVEYDSFTGQQSMIVSCIPIEEGVEKAAIEETLRELGTDPQAGERVPIRADVRKTLDDCGIVHFVSASIVDSMPDRPADGSKPITPRQRRWHPIYLVLELNLDGDKARAIDRFAAYADDWLGPLLRLARPGDKRTAVKEGRTPGAAKIIRKHALKLHFRPWRSVGLNFYGTGDYPVAMIEKQRALRERAEKELDLFFRGEGPGFRPDTRGHDGKADFGLGNRATAALASVRRALRERPEDRPLAAFLVQPSGKLLRLAKWDKVPPLKRVLFEPDVKLRDTLAVRFGVFFLATAAFLGLWADFALRKSSGFSLGAFWRHVGHTLAALWPVHFGKVTSAIPYVIVVALLAVLLTLFLWGVIGGLAYGIFRAVEAREKSDDRKPSTDKIRDVEARENYPGYLQNHITAVTPLKRGIVRRLALSVALWGIRQSLNWFRPGFVVTMGTIHYAKWFVLPKSRKLIFQANYDGSWESYLEDFIARANKGQTAAWSNGEGFPKSVGLIGEGAKDGERFKRWVRRQQVPTPFWYSRFPDMTADDIRTNAILHDGLARAGTESAAHAWLDLLGSAPRQANELESTEIQSLVFLGMSKARFTACIPLRLPEARLSDDKSSNDRLLEEAKLRRGMWLKDILPQLSFGRFPAARPAPYTGDAETKSLALYLALSPSGIRKLSKDAPAGPAQDLLKFFPAPFAMGMANRAPLLGDPIIDGDTNAWRWSDLGGNGHDEAHVADAVLLVYAADGAQLTNIVDAQIAKLKELGGSIVRDRKSGGELVIRTVPVKHDGHISKDAKDHSYEHFGFRDGISTPAIAGAEPPSAPSHDVVQPGEFILGYRNNQGYFVPSVMVPAGSDIGEELPVAAAEMSFGFTKVDEMSGPFAPRDLGRNGTYVVLRELEQDRVGFHNFAVEKTAELVAHYGSDRLRETVGTEVNPNWFKAKLLGRWQDGRSLVGNPKPLEPGKAPPRLPENDFQYGRDDPRGHACPLGAHARRTNPRDSLLPGDRFEEDITRRHLIIRRGRTYFRNSSGEYPIDSPAENAERGLLFVGLCADLERQFEFIQQTWINFPGFHGLRNEPDPIAAPDNASHLLRNDPEPENGGARKFTIPTAAGPLVVKGMKSFVDFHGGGYFFLPSRSAIRYFVQFSDPDPVGQKF